MKNTIKFLFLSLSLLLSACAKEKMTHVSPDFVVFAKRFQEEAAKQGVYVSIDNVKIAFDDDYPLNGNVLGVCRYGGPLVVPEIYISRYWWNHSYLSQISSKEQLMFHEMGHCILNRGHRDERIIDPFGYSVQVSIMNSTHFAGSRYENNYYDYMAELFLGITSYTLSDYKPNQFPSGAYGDYASMVAFASSVETETKARSNKIVEHRTDHTFLTDENGNPVFGCGSDDEDHEHQH